ncbi:hypothetical protein P4T04_05370 [Bacillus badius]|uniref:hypothetical protein n=1 Tax=Bacillus badius TaxID=1455 RepID=UPI002E1D5129|nr:hypothetical protein [Bacillus badius]
MQLTYSDVKQIQTLEDPAEVNRKLKSGWTLLHIATASGDGHSYLIYVIGWTRKETEEEYARLLEQLEELGF